MKLRRIVVTLLVLTGLVGNPGYGATPDSITLTDTEPEAAWTGSFELSNPVDCDEFAGLPCDHVSLTVVTGEVQEITVLVWAGYGLLDDIDLFVYDSEGNEVDRSASSSGFEEVTFLHDPAVEAGSYSIVVQPWLVDPGLTYEGNAFMGSSDSCYYESASGLVASRSSFKSSPLDVIKSESRLGRGSRQSSPLDLRRALHELGGESSFRRARHEPTGSNPTSPIFGGPRRTWTGTGRKTSSH